MNVSPEVIQTVAAMIGKYWRDLADSLGLKWPERRLYHDHKWNMLQCLRERNMIWHELKHGLENVNRGDIIQKIYDEFDIDTDEIHSTNHLLCTIRSHGSIEIFDVNQQSKVKPLKGNHKISYIAAGNTKNTMTLNEWDETCSSYFQRYYKQHGKVIFPPQKDNGLCHDMLAQKLIDDLDSQEGDIYLFTRYDLINHLRFHVNDSETFNKTLNDLLITSDRDLKCSNNRMLLFNTKYRILLNIRVTESTDVAAIHNEERKGRSDLKLLLFLNQRFIESNGTTLANVVLSPNISLDGSSKICSDCLIMDQNVLNAKRDVRRWFKTCILPKTKLKDEINNADSFTQIVSSIFGFVGTRQVTYEGCGSFPMFRRDNTAGGDEHQEITNLMFTYDQSRVINHPALKKIVFGGFGAGKSLIGQCQLEELARQEANTNNHIFYICWDDRSMIYLQMKNFVEDVKKSTQNQNLYSFSRGELVEEYLELSKVPAISEMFEKVKAKWEDGTVHIIIEEFELESLNDLQADNLKVMFNTAEWKPSHVLLLPQPLEKERTVISNAKEVSKSQNAAYKRIGMVHFTLSQHMRSTNSNFDFAKISTNIITTKVKNSINHHKKVSESFDVTSIHTAMENEAVDNNVHIKSTHDTVSDVEEDKPSFQLPVPLEDTVSDVEEDTVSDVEEDTVSDVEDDTVSDVEEDKPSFQLPVPLDELQVYGTSTNPDRTETIYSCRQCNTMGHGIKGKKPKLIFFNQEVTAEAGSICELTMVLEELLFCRNCERLWLCKNIDEFQLCTNILKLSDQDFVHYHPLSGYKLLDKEGNILEELPQGYDVVTDNKGSRGTEYHQVIIFIPSTNSNEQEVFLEMINRCTSEIIIICPFYFDIDNPGLMPPILHQIMEAAILQDKIQQCVITNCEIDDTDVPIQRSVVDGKEYFCINYESGEYKEKYSMVKQLSPVAVSTDKKFISPFDAPKGLKCMTCYDEEVLFCKLSWNQSPFDFVIMKKNQSTDNMKFTSKPTSESTYIFKDLTKGEDYMFSVVTISSLGESIPAQLPWRHVDLFRLIQYVVDRHDEVKRIIDMFPWRIHDEDEVGWSLYHHAAMRNKPDILDYLLHVDKTYMNKRDRLSGTPLHYASYDGHIDCVHVLLTHGADSTIKHYNGRTPYDWVCGLTYDNTHEEEIKNLLKKYTKN